MFLIKSTLVDSMWGHIKIPGGECHSMCTWGHHFPPLISGLIRVFCSSISLRVTSYTQMTMMHAQTFPPKVIMMSSKHHLVMSQWCGGVLDDDIYITRYVRVGAYKRMNTRWKGFPVPSCKFWGCRAHRASLITSRVLQCAPTAGQPGILHLCSEMCWVHWLLSQRS